MAQTLRFAFPLPNGLHARPASHFADVAHRFGCVISFVNERNGRTADARSVLGLVGTATRANDACRLELAGGDEAAAGAAFQTFLAGAFLRCDTELVPDATEPGEILIPRSLRAAGLETYVAGRVAARGLGRGRAVLSGGLRIPTDLATGAASDPAAEEARFDEALNRVALDLQQESRAADGPAAAVLRAHLAIVGDATLRSAVVAGIQGGRPAAHALAEAVAWQRQILGAAESAYVRERVIDVEDVAGRLWERLCGPGYRRPTLRLAEPSIVFAEALSPSQFLALDRAHLRAVVLARAGQTSHAVILARSFGVPTLTGVADAVALGQAGSEVIVDANLGIVIAGPDARLRKYYDGEEAKYRRLTTRNAAQQNRLGATADGRRLEIGANIASLEEAAAAFAQGAEGIGLLRTELLFSGRDTAPDEATQYALYAGVVTAAAGRPVIIRTLDAGGDKPVAFLPRTTEANPFLGYRGARLYREHADLIRTQLRAILRAAALGPVKVLVPMISSVEEARFVRQLLGEARAELVARGEAVPESIPFGLMIEVPATAFILDELCAEADFFSLGTNDLAQYFSAADRENPRVAALHDPLQPAFVRLLRQIVMRVRAHGRWIGLCGEMAEHPAALPLLVALGLDEISLAAPRIPATKAALARLEYARAVPLLEQVLACATRSAVDHVLSHAASNAEPLLLPELVLNDVVAASKEEVLRLVADALQVAGRTDTPAAIEAAVWRREEAYSTGFGEGFALPHAKTDALRANSIVLVRLRTAVEWGALDGKPVDVVIFLGIRASDHAREHLATLARLSRLVTHDTFRDAVRQERDPAALLTLLSPAAALPGNPTP
ncbi:phosphoenolpyruvate--protein phosphotransferase [Opitutus sp. ER46]|uniref:phosphoenolpyruvate--protein phosphotransferase n=1 Tax=Opitutus sp. ER46 TaxID=2161864 RepID=UPI0011B28859|nr:phosphoenolpyruvate--protein phosphotransferase [Opitutus sp. ER46]